MPLERNEFEWWKGPDTQDMPMLSQLKMSATGCEDSRSAI